MIDPYEIIGRFYPKGCKLYDILVIHSECVRDKALECAKKHPELDIDIEFVKEAAMLHDIGILHTYAPPIECMGTHLYIEHGALGAEMLRQLGLERHARVCERHTGTGLTAEYVRRMHYPLPEKDMMPETLEEKLICYADKFYSKNKDLREAKPIEIVRQKLAKWEDCSAERFDELHKLFG